MQSEDRLCALLASLDSDNPRAAIQAIDAYRQSRAVCGAREKELDRLTRRFSALVVNALLEREAAYMSGSYHAELCCCTIERASLFGCEHRWRDPDLLKSEIAEICHRIQEQ